MPKGSRCPPTLTMRDAGIRTGGYPPCSAGGFATQSAALWPRGHARQRFRSEDRPAPKQYLGPDAVDSPHVWWLTTDDTNGIASRVEWCQLNSSVVSIVHDRRVALAVEERPAIYELIALHGHLMDAGAF